MKKKIKAAVTGNIGSGKTSFCNYLKEKGFTVLSADDIAKDILQNDTKVKKKITSVFGSEAYKDDKLNKKFLAETVFADPANVVIINDIVHPAVFKILEAQMAEALKTKNMVFVEAALIYEADMEDMFDFVILIWADEKIRAERALLNGFSKEEFERRNGNQIAEDEKKKRADFAFENKGTTEQLKTKADLLISILEGIPVIND